MQRRSIAGVPTAIGTPFNLFQARTECYFAATMKQLAQQSLEESRNVLVHTVLFC